MTARDNSSNPNHSSARQIRMIALIIGLLSLAVVGGLISMIFFAADEVPVAAVGPISAGPGAERGGLVFKGTVGLWEINGRQTADASRRVHFSMEVTGASGQPAPPTLEMRWVLDLPESGLPEILVASSRVGAGRYVGVAQLQVDGQWRLRIQTPNVTGRFMFYVDPLNQ